MNDCGNRYGRQVWKWQLDDESTYVEEGRRKMMCGGEKTCLPAKNLMQGRKRVMSDHMVLESKQIVERSVLHSGDSN